MTTNQISKLRKRIGKRWYHVLRARSMRRMYNYTVSAYLDRKLNSEDTDRLLTMYSNRYNWHINKIGKK